MPKELPVSRVPVGPSVENLFVYALRFLAKSIVRRICPPVYKLFESSWSKGRRGNGCHQVDTFRGPVLLASGHAMQSGRRTRWVIDLFTAEGKRLQYKYEHLKYKDAGHTLNEKLYDGGTFEETRRQN